MKEIVIDQMLPSDWAQTREIYLEGIATGNATFQSEAPSWEEWDKSHLQQCRIVARCNDQVVGWAALTPVSGRCVYYGVAEVSVYVSQKMKGQGVGNLIMQALIEATEQANFWTLQSGVFPENIASLHLHKKYGFREVGVRERIGKMDHQWRDVVLLERRSAIVGV